MNPDDDPDFIDLNVTIGGKPVEKIKFRLPPPPCPHCGKPAPESEALCPHCWLPIK